MSTSPPGRWSEAATTPTSTCPRTGPGPARSRALRQARTAPDRRSSLELRRFEETDAATVWRLHEDGLGQMNTHAGPGPWDDDLHSVRASYLEDGGEFLVGVIDGAVVAMGALRRVSETVAEVKRMRVDSRFQRQGFGPAILRRLEERARELGYSTLCLDTAVTQVPAQHLYRSSGYREVRRTRLGGQELLLFERQLA